MVGHTLKIAVGSRMTPAFHITDEFEDEWPTPFEVGVNATSPHPFFYLERSIVHGNWFHVPYICHLGCFGFQS